MIHIAGLARRSTYRWLALDASSCGCSDTNRLFIISPYSFIFFFFLGVGLTKLTGAGAKVVTVVVAVVEGDFGFRQRQRHASAIFAAGKRATWEGRFVRLSTLMRVPLSKVSIWKCLGGRNAARFCWPHWVLVTVTTAVLVVVLGDCQ